MLAKYGYLPTQIAIGDGPYSAELRKSIPYYDQLISLIKYGRSRPNLAEYPQIAEHISEAIDAVYSGSKQPKQALDDAAAKSAKALGW
jgi:multiple sugar transport system substrate-binding protein